MSHKRDESSDDSDEEYVPPQIKRSKPTNSESDQEPELAERDQKCESLGKPTLDALWQEFKQDSTALSSHTISTTATESHPQGKDKIKLEISDPPASKCVTEDKGYKIGRDAPKKSRLNQLLTTRAVKKRQKPENILNSSKRDWECLKVREDLSEELTHHNKDGFIRRQEFLKRCEEREHDGLLEARKRKK